MGIKRHKLTGLPIAVGSLTALRNLPFVSFPIWRLANIVSLALLIVQESRISSVFIVMAAAINCIILYLIGQMFITEICSYNFASACGFAILLYFSFAVAVNAGKFNLYLIRGLRSTACVVFAYQCLQIVLYFTGHSDLMYLLNDSTILKQANASRFVGILFGPPSFMAESGHIAIFVGPLMSILLIFEKIKFLHTPKLMYFAFILSLILTLSGGAFVEIAFISMTAIIIERSVFKKFLVITGIAGCLFIVSFVLSDYTGLIMYKIQALRSGSSSRVIGTQGYWVAFSENPLFGIGPDAVRGIRGDPNMLLPILLAGYGIIGVFMFSVLMVIFPIMLWLRTTTKLFIIPLIAMYFHLILAYGTLTWPYIWSNFALAIFGLFVGMKTTRQIDQSKQFKMN